MNGNSMKRVPYGAVVALTLSACLAGCVGSPTYGTDRTANEQLLDDLTGIVALGPRESQQVSNNPRGEIVVPANRNELPAPQQSALAGDNAQWPESPEARRARLRAEATENQGNVQYRSPIRQAQSGEDRSIVNARSHQPGGHDRLPEGVIAQQQQRSELNARLQERRQGSATTRRYLSDPPLAYRQPADTAPAGDVGEEEWRKERDRARATNQGRGWRDMLPW